MKRHCRNYLVIRIGFYTLLVLAFTASAHAQSPHPGPAELATTLESFRARGDIPGMVALVLRGDRIIAQGAVGVRKRGMPQHVTLDDPFHLGSSSKAMTGTLVAILIEGGKLKWTTTLGDLFGDTVQDMHPDWKSVTVQQVLAHRAGFPPGNDPTALLDGRLAASKKAVTQLRQMLVASQLAQRPQTPPGTKWVYSNVGYIVVGAALEKTTGVAWEDLMRERLFKPLGITTGGFGAPGTPGKVDAPWGHDEKGNPVDPGSPDSDNPPYFGPCGSVHMTIRDWAKFVTLHLQGDPANPKRQVHLLKPESFGVLHHGKPGETYSAGLARGTIDFAKGSRPEDKAAIFGHEGSNGLWYCKMLAAPEINLAVLVACNRGGDAVGGKAVSGATLELMQRFASTGRASK
jgi:CubicO group peptidase (beta-lactamase class C family)